MVLGATQAIRHTITNRQVLTGFKRSAGGLYFYVPQKLFCRSWVCVMDLDGIYD
jgi:hypothetical protein